MECSATDAASHGENMPLIIHKSYATLVNY